VEAVVVRALVVPRLLVEPERALEEELVALSHKLRSAASEAGESVAWNQSPSRIRITSILAARSRLRVTFNSSRSSIGPI
jgi:hypothetical protein